MRNHKHDTTAMLFGHYSITAGDLCRCEHHIRPIQAMPCPSGSKLEVQRSVFTPAAAVTSAAVTAAAPEQLAPGNCMPCSLIPALTPSIAQMVSNGLAKYFVALVGQIGMTWHSSTSQHHNIGVQ